MSAADVANVKKKSGMQATELEVLFKDLCQQLDPPIKSLQCEVDRLQRHCHAEKRTKLKRR